MHASTNSASALPSLIRAAATASPSELESAQKALGADPDGAAPPEITQADLSALIAVYKAIQEADQSLVHLSRNVIDRLAAGAAVEAGPHTFEHNQPGGGHVLIVDGEWVYEG